MSMTRDELVATVQSLVGDTAGAEFDTTTITRFLNLAQQDIARQTEFLLKKIVSTTITATTSVLPQSYALPTDFLQISRVLWDTQPLYPIDSDEVKKFTDVAAGTPFAYYLWGGAYIRFYPESTAVTGLNLVLEYVCKPAAFTSGTTQSGFPDHFDQVLIDFAVSRVKFIQEDNDGYSTMKQSYSTGLAEAKSERNLREWEEFGQIRDCDPDLNQRSLDW